MMQQTKKF
jgi:hypothetical protein